SSMQPPFIDWRGEWLKAGFDSRSPHCPQILYKGCDMAHSFLQSTKLYLRAKKSCDDPQGERDSAIVASMVTYLANKLDYAGSIPAGCISPPNFRKEAKTA
ncbi:hypothetical protein EFT87_12895, partial [Schleiferilactobacillus harbinensis]|nr:hypothetical protein [Schleiferilactobacillus harbinensis]